MARLRYIGAGAKAGAWVPGWPATDHDDDDAERIAAKVASGLYELAESAPAEPPAEAPKRKPRTRRTGS